MSSEQAGHASSAGKLHSVQALRAVAVLLVVWLHISAPHGFEARYIGGTRLTHWMHYPTLISVDLFFIISGVIITTTAWRSSRRRVRGAGSPIAGSRGSTRCT